MLSQWYFSRTEAVKPDGIWIILDDQLDHRFYRRGIEEIFLAVVVGRRGNDHKVRVLICGFCLQRRSQIQFLFNEMLLYVLILNGRLLLMDQLYRFWNNIHRRYMMVLCQQSGNGQADIAGSCYCSFHRRFFSISSFSTPSY